MTYCLSTSVHVCVHTHNALSHIALSSSVRGCNAAGPENRWDQMLQLLLCAIFYSAFGCGSLRGTSGTRIVSMELMYRNVMIMQCSKETNQIFSSGLAAFEEGIFSRLFNSISKKLHFPIEVKI